MLKDKAHEVVDFLLQVLEKIFILFEIPFNEAIEEITDLRPINFSESQDHFFNEKLVELRKLINKLLELEENIKDLVLIENLKFCRRLFIKIRTNLNFIYHLIKLYWSIQHVIIREEILTDENYNKSIINYNWVMSDEITDFLETLIDKKSMSINSDEFQSLDIKYRDPMFNLNLIKNENEVIFPTSLAIKLINSISIDELFNYYQQDFDELLDSIK
ncbi:MAG: hypothetical protein ACTSX4_02195 [Candidatus Helarchaeota archaeon]